MSRTNRSQLNVSFLAVGISILMLGGGCVSMETVPEYAVNVKEIEPPKSNGIYHKVSKKETIWKIAKAYDVTISEIIESNNIPDMAKIEVDQLVFIPGAVKTREVLFSHEGKKEDFAWPIKGKIIGYFNQRNTQILSHGVDIKAARGDIVKASRSGKVVFADYLPGQSYMVIIDHQDGFYTVYSKNAKLLVKYGDHVNKSDSIAHVGEQDQLAYLHFEIRKNNKADNPLYYLP
ncbi:MAG: peptidoglycan DD-metalloendopeptidase family protein [Candidatus Omnitrophota bacterium]